MAQAVAVSLPALYQFASFISLFIYLFLCVGEANKIKIKIIVIVLTIFHLHWVLTLFTIAIAIFTLRSEAKRKRLSEKDFKVKTRRFATQFDFRVFLLPNFKGSRIQLMREKFQDVKKHFGLGQEY